jgi:hypothetical protein
MFGLLKELADRFIEFVLRFVKGETVEEQLTSALKSAVFLIAILAWAAIGLSMANINLRVELSDMEAGVAKMNLLFDPTEGGPLKAFVRINDSLSNQLRLVKQENLLLFQSNIKLNDENNFLRPYLVRSLAESERLKINNDVLLKMCAPGGLKKLPR